MSYHFGVATADITPPIGVLLWGYQPRESEFVGHPLRAEALACSSGEHGWILVSADIGGFLSSFTLPVREEIAKATGLSSTDVMLVATHTHSGPRIKGGREYPLLELEGPYLAELSRRLVAVALSAWQSRSPGELLYASTEAPELGSNRRVQSAGGTWTNEWRDPDRTHTGYFDSKVELLAVRRNERLDAIVVNYGCHPVCFGSNYRGISGDYVSYLKDCLEEGGLTQTVLFAPSGHANIDPCECVQNDAKVTRSVGESLAEIVADALDQLEPIPHGPVGAVCLGWEFTTEWEIPQHLMGYVHAGGEGEQVQTQFSALRVGPVALLGLPGEVVSEYRRTFAERSDFDKTLLFSLANDFVGYLPTDAIIEQGAYESKMSPLKKLENELLTKVDSLLDGLKTACNGGG